MKLLCSLLFVGFLLCACGGGSEDTPVQPTPFSSDARTTLSGEWPTAVNYYLVRDQQHWDQVWTQRRAGMDCSRSYNVSACQASSPPAVDFTRFMVVGVYLDRVFTFVGQPQHIRAFRDSEGLFVEFRSSPQVASGANPAAEPAGEFFLLPSTLETVTFRPAGT